MKNISYPRVLNSTNIKWVSSIVKCMLKEGWVLLDVDGQGIIHDEWNKMSN